MEILHFSDLHNQHEVNRLVVELCKAHQRTSDVLCITGDLSSETTPRAEAVLNRAPQRYRLAVPGNHDRPDTFDELSESWTLGHPWAKWISGSLFIGLNSEVDAGAFDAQTDELKAEWIQSESSPPDLVTVLVHSPIGSEKAMSLRSLIDQVAPDTIPVLVLHGHSHPRGFRGRWYKSTLAGRPTTCSHVCSCNLKGFGHRIRWADAALTCTTITPSRP